MTKEEKKAARKKELDRPKIDLFGNELLLHTEGAGCYDPMPIATR